jgi:hypothetical protein
MALNRVKGASQLRRTLRRLPNDTQAELGSTFTAVAQRLGLAAKAETPVRSGRLRGLIGAKALVKSLRINVGLLTRGANRDGFYGYILDAGRRAQTVRAKRRTGTSYALRVKGISRQRYNFVSGRLRDFLRTDLPKVRDAISRGLSRAARGGGGSD